MPNISLRPYQQKFIDDIRKEFRNNHKRVVGVAPCGAGKTIMTGWMIRESLNRAKRSIFFVHRHELIEQTSKTFNDLQIPHGIIAADSPMQLELPVQIASVQTLARRLGKIPTPDFLICDECHHILANSYKKILDAFPDAFLLGVTATPRRTGGINLGDVFTSMVESLSVNELIKLGNLTDFKYFTPSCDIDFSSIHCVCGDFNNNELEKALKRPQISGNIIDAYNNFAKDKSAICYCVNTNHSRFVADAFLNAGISAAHVDADSPKAERANFVDDFRRGKIKVLCNADLFGEGFDVPNCQAVILARPTKSLTLFIQQAMRAMRPDPNDPNKVAVIIDHVGNYKRHGYPNDVHSWSLDPNNPKGTGDAPTKPCPDCGHNVAIGARFCPNCNHEFKLIEIFHDDTQMLQDHEPNLKQSILDLRSPEDFLAFSKRFNYKIGWVAFQALKFANSYDDCLHIAQICGYKKGWAWHKWHDLQQSKEA